MKKNFEIEFELFGKRMKLTNVQANDKNDAMNYVKNKIKFHSIKQKNENDESIFETIDWDKINDRMNKTFDNISNNLNNTFDKFDKKLNEFFDNKK